MNFIMVPHLRVPCPHANARVGMVLSSAVARCGVEQRHTMGLFLEEHRIIRTCVPLRAQHAMFFNTTRIDQASTPCLAQCQILGTWRPGHGPCLQQGPCRARWLSTTCDNSSLRAFFFQKCYNNQRGCYWHLVGKTRGADCPVKQGTVPQNDELSNSNATPRLEILAQIYQL